MCKQLHMPAQSGSSTMLDRMRRGYTRQAYDDLVEHVRELVPGVSLSTDIISGTLLLLYAGAALLSCRTGALRNMHSRCAKSRLPNLFPLLAFCKFLWGFYGSEHWSAAFHAPDFEDVVASIWAALHQSSPRRAHTYMDCFCAAGFCSETEEEHLDTLDLMRKTQYDQAFMFAYSEREKTHASRHLEDDVPAEVKSRRLQEIIATFREWQLKQYQAEIGRTHLVSFLFLSAGAEQVLHKLLIAALMKQSQAACGIKASIPLLLCYTAVSMHKMSSAATYITSKYSSYDRLHVLLGSCQLASDRRLAAENGSFWCFH